MLKASPLLLMTFTDLPFPHLVPILPHTPHLDCCVSLPGTFSLSMSPVPIPNKTHPLHSWLSSCVCVCFPFRRGTLIATSARRNLAPLVTGRAALCDWWWLGSGTWGGSFSPPAPTVMPTVCSERGPPSLLASFPPSASSWNLSIISLPMLGNSFQASNLGLCKLALEPFLFLKVVAI